MDCWRDTFIGFKLQYWSDVGRYKSITVNALLIFNKKDTAYSVTL